MNDPLVGKVLDGRYEIQARIGEGGMGVVYRARQISIDRVLALKMLNPQMASDPTWVQRFYNEAKACSRLQHQNTIRMFDFGQTSDGRLFMTMEFLDGISLRAALQNGPLAPQRVVKIMIQCCASLAEAHAIGIIHRDIKPDNVFLLNMAGSPDFVKLLDFSVAKLLEGDRMKTQAGVVFGTPQYMSPEQGRGLPLDARSDLYALGILAFEMLTGTVPFHDDNPMTVIQMHLHAGVPPMPDSVPYPVQQVVRRALEKDTARRFQSAGEMMAHCQQIFAELTAGSVPIGGLPRTVNAPGGPPHMQPPHMQQPMHPMQPMQPMMQQPMQQMQQSMPPQQMQQPMQQMPQMQQSMPPQQMQQQMQQPMQQPMQYQQASPQQKTMIAAPNPFHQQPATQPAGGPIIPGVPNVVTSSPMQKTIIAGMAPPFDHNMAMPGAQPGMPAMHPGMAPHMGPGMAPGMPMPGMPGMPGPGMPGVAQGGPNKTVALASTEGIVSLARGTPALPAAGIQQGASTLFWVVSLLTGIAVGAIAYLIVANA